VKLNEGGGHEKKKGMTKYDLDIAEFLRLGGRKIPAGVAAKARAATKSMLLKETELRDRTRMEGAKLYGELKGGSPIAVDDPANRKTEAQARKGSADAGTATDEENNNDECRVEY
jgi:hypothetical protein